MRTTAATVSQQEAAVQHSPNAVRTTAATVSQHEAAAQHRPNSVLRNDLESGDGWAGGRAHVCPHG